MGPCDPRVPTGRAFVMANTHPFKMNLGTAPGLFAAYSSDCGLSWTAYRFAADPNGPLPLARPRGDPWAVFTDTGKLYVSYLVEDPNILPTTTAVARSDDGGASFAFVDALPDLETGSDRGSIAAGPGSAGAAGSLWATFTIPASGIMAAGAALDAQGNPVLDPSCSPPRAFCQQHVVSSDLPFFPGHVAVGPQGQVLVTWLHNFTPPGPTQILAALDLDGLGSAPFSAPEVVLETNVGIPEAVPPHMVRRIGPLPNLAWDLSTGRVYLAAVTEEPEQIGDTEIVVLAGELDATGTSIDWGDPVRVNDDPLGDGDPTTLDERSQFLPAVAVDQTSGQVAVAWQDPRDDDGGADGLPNTETEAYLALSSDGGQSFLNRVVAKGFSKSTDEETSHGEYMGVAIHGRIASVAWSDNSNSAGDNPDASDPPMCATDPMTPTPGAICMDIYFAPEPGARIQGLVCLVALLGLAAWRRTRRATPPPLPPA